MVQVEIGVVVLIIVSKTRKITMLKELVIQITNQFAILQVVWICVFPQEHAGLILVVTAMI